MSTSVEAARQASRNNRSFVEQSNTCGCFYCMKIFSPRNIVKWIDDDQTALCPYCGIDSVVSGHSIAVTDELLRNLNRDFFGKSKLAKTNKNPRSDCENKPED